MSTKLRVFSLVISILMLVCLSLPVFAATSKAENALEELKNPNGKILGISSKGDWGEEPENSVPAIIKAARTGIDFVLVDIRKTSDGKLIVFSDDSAGRMLSADENYIIASTDYGTLSQYRLKKGCGGSNAEESDCYIPLIDDAIKAAKENDTALIFRADASLLSDISGKIDAYGIKNSSAVMMRNKAGDIADAAAACDDPPYIIGTIRSNVIFKVHSFIKGLEDLGAPAVVLKSSNRYGINYQTVVLDRWYPGIRLIADTTTPVECGARTDTEKWWNDLVSRGYSVIVTDHPGMFTEYLSRTDDARARLSEAYKKYTEDYTLPEFSNKHLNDYKKAYTDAVASAGRLLSDGSSSVQDMNDTYTDLKNAINNIDINYNALEDGSAGTTITVPRIILCILAAAAVIAVQVFFFRNRKQKGD